MPMYRGQIHFSSKKVTAYLKKITTSLLSCSMTFSSTVALALTEVGTIQVRRTAAFASGGWESRFLLAPFRSPRLGVPFPSFYVLGLDSSLPTKPWSKNEEVTWDSIDSYEFEEILHSTVLAYLDFSTPLERTNEMIVRKSYGYRDGLPSTTLVSAEVGTIHLTRKRCVI
jgi:hypothetical protein